MLYSRSPIVVVGVILGLWFELIALAVGCKYMCLGAAEGKSGKEVVKRSF